MPRKKAPETSHPLARLMEAFQKRVHQIIEVIDEALGSEELKHRIWAVELLLKRFSPEKNATANSTRSSKQPTLPNLSKLSDNELMSRIRHLLENPTQGEDHAPPSD